MSVVVLWLVSGMVVLRIVVVSSMVLSLSARAVGFGLCGV